MRLLLEILLEIYLDCLPNCVVYSSCIKFLSNNNHTLYAVACPPFQMEGFHEFQNDTWCQLIAQDINQSYTL